MNDIREIMITEPSICTPLTSIENIQKQMAEAGTKEILVVDTILEKHLVGVITENDILEKAQTMDVAPESLSAEQCMKTITITAPITATIDQCDHILRVNHIDQLAIVDRDGHLCGVYHKENPIRH